MNRKRTVVLQCTGAPMPKAAPTTEKQASCEVETGHFIQVLAAVTIAAVNIMTIAPKGVMNRLEIIPVPRVVTTLWLSNVAPRMTKKAISSSAVMGFLMIPAP
jgi:hypothetical protein